MCAWGVVGYLFYFQGSDRPVRKDFLWHLWDENVTEHWHWLIVLWPVLVTPNLNGHTHINTQTHHIFAADIIRVVQDVTRPVLWILFHNSGKSPLTHSAFLITLREHGDGVCSRFPDHSPKVSHCARQGALGGDELVGTKVALENKKSGRWQKLKQ